MLGRIFPLLLALVGLGGGIGAGLALRPAAETAAVAATADADAGCTHDCAAPSTDGADHAAADAAAGHDGGHGEASTEFVKMNNQFVVPVVRESDIAALVVMSISLEVPTGGSEPVYQREPKLRDVFLQVLFDHANAGGFDGTFTAGPNMQVLRTALLEAARGALGQTVIDLLITDIARQDM